MHLANHAPQLRIGEFAAELGLNPKTIRHYEEIGLLPAPRRMPNGYRLYDASDRQRLCFIAKAKAIGLTLDEVCEILVLRGRGESPCDHVLALLDRKLAKVDEQLHALLEFRHELVALREEAVDTMRADACVCGKIEQHRPARQDEPYQ
jgi:MerR family transcriptional regulator, Zn(II)-responsive regulator of zntA